MGVLLQASLDVALSQLQRLCSAEATLSAAVRPISAARQIEVLDEGAFF